MGDMEIPCNSDTDIPTDPSPQFHTLNSNRLQRSEWLRARIVESRTDEV